MSLFPYLELPIAQRAPVDQLCVVQGLIDASLIVLCNGKAEQFIEQSGAFQALDASKSIMIGCISDLQDQEKECDRHVEVGKTLAVEYIEDEVKELLSLTWQLLGQSNAGKVSLTAMIEDIAELTKKLDQRVSDIPEFAVD